MLLSQSKYTTGSQSIGTFLKGLFPIKLHKQKYNSLQKHQAFGWLCLCLSLMCYKIDRKSNGCFIFSHAPSQLLLLNSCLCRHHIFIQSLSLSKSSLSDHHQHCQQAKFKTEQPSNYFQWITSKISHQFGHKSKVDGGLIYLTE